MNSPPPPPPVSASFADFLRDLELPEGACSNTRCELPHAITPSFCHPPPPHPHPTGLSRESIPTLTAGAFLREFVQRSIESATAITEAAADAATIEFKAEREAIRNEMHAANLGGADAPVPVHDVELRVMSVPKGSGGPVDAVYRLSPRPGVMCRIGRAQSAEFVAPLGCSVYWDDNASTWHGKVTAAGGGVWAWWASVRGVQGAWAPCTLVLAKRFASERGRCS